MTAAQRRRRMLRRVKRKEQARDSKRRYLAWMSPSPKRDRRAV